MKLIDIAVNLTDSVFRGVYNGKQVHVDDLLSILQRAKNVGITKMMVTGTNLSDSREAILLAKQHPTFLYATVGTHPTRCNEFKSNPDEYLNQLKQLILDNKGIVVAVGECGLDYDRLQFCDKDTQAEYFSKQLYLAHELNMPCFLHNRGTNGDFVQTIKTHLNAGVKIRGCVHSFDGSESEMLELINLGLSIGINGCSLKTDENINVLKKIPIDRLLIETDAPWCDVRPTHASYSYVRWKPQDKPVKKEKFVTNAMIKGRNEPCMTMQILDIISAVKQIPIDELADKVYENTINLFFNE